MATKTGLLLSKTVCDEARSLGKVDGSTLLSVVIDVNSYFLIGTSGEKGLLTSSSGDSHGLQEAERLVNFSVCCS